MPILELPSGRQVDVPNLPPKGTDKEKIKRALIANGYATEEDFAPTIAGSESLAAFGLGVGKGMAGAIQGAEQLLGTGTNVTGLPPKAEQERLFTAVSGESPIAADAGQITGETLITAPIGAGVGGLVAKGIGPIAGRVPAAAKYLPTLVGAGTEGAIIGAQDDNAISGGLLSGTLAATIQALTPAVARRITAYFGNKVNVADMITVTPDGNIAPTPQGQQLAQQNGLDLNRIIEEAKQEVIPPMAAPEPSIQKIEQVATASAQKPEQAIQSLVPELSVNPARAKAAAEEGMQLTPGALSDDPTFIRYQAALQDMPGSKLAAQQLDSIKKIGEKVDQLKFSIAETLDKGQVDMNVVDTFNKSNAAIKEKEARLYGEISDTMKGSGTMMPENIFSLIDEKAAEVGGIDKLSAGYPALAAIAKKLEVIKKDGGATYQYLDSLKKAVGEGYQKAGDEAFRNASGRELDMIYGALAQDATNFVEAVDPVQAKRLAAANKITQVRKGLEEKVQSFSPQISPDGKVLVSAKYVDRIDNSLREAARTGNPQTFNALIESVPKKHRAEVVISAIDALLSTKRIQTGQVTAAMKDQGINLLRQKTAKDAIYKHLPEYAQKRLDNLFLVSEGIFNVKAAENVSGTAKSVILALEEQQKALAKLYGTAARVTATVGVGSTGGVGAIAAGQAGNVADVLTAKTKVAVKADDLLSSHRFQQAVADFAKNETGIAEARIKNTPEYKEWLKLQDANTKEAIKKMGFLKWLTGSSVGALPEKQEEQPYDPNAMLQKQAMDDANMIVDNFGNDLVKTYGVKANPRISGIDLFEVTSHPKEVGMALLGEVYQEKPDYIPVAENYIELAMGKPEYERQIEVVGNILQNSGIIPPDDKEEFIARSVSLGVKPEKAFEIANTIKPVSKKEAQKIAEAIRAKILPEQYQDFAPLLQSIEALA